MIELTPNLVLAIRAKSSPRLLQQIFNENLKAGYEIYHRSPGLHAYFKAEEVPGYLWEALLKLIDEYDPSKGAKPLTRWLCLLKYQLRSTQKQSKYRASVRVPYDPRCPQYTEIRFQDASHQEAIMNDRHNVAWSDEYHELVEEIEYVKPVYTRTRGIG